MAPRFRRDRQRLRVSRANILSKREKDERTTATITCNPARLRGRQDAGPKGGSKGDAKGKGKDTKGKAGKARCCLLSLVCFH